MRILEAQRANLTKSIPAHLRDEKEIQKEIKNKKRQFETQASHDERAVIKEIDGLKKALVDMQKYTSEVAPELDSLKAKKSAAQKKLDNVKK